MAGAPLFDWDQFLASEPLDDPSLAAVPPAGSYDWETQLRSIAPGTLAVGGPSAIAAPASGLASWDFGAQWSSGIGLGFGPEIRGFGNYLRAPADSPLTLQQQIYNAREAKSGFEHSYPGASQMTEIAGSLPTLAIANELTGPAALMRSGALGTRALGSAYAGAEAGALQTRITGGDMEGNIERGALFGLGLPAAGAVTRNALMPFKVDPNVIASVKDLETAGVNLRPTQVAMSAAVRRADQLLAGGGDERQLRDFTRALSKTFGADTEALTDDALDAAEQALKTRADAITASTSVVLTPTLNREMALISGSLKGLSQSDQNQVRQVIREIRQSFTNGQLDGKTYQRLTQRGGPVANLAGGSPSVREAGGKLKELLDDEVERASPPGTRDKWSEIRQQFRNLNTIRPLAVRNPAGLVDPASLVGKINQMPAGDLRTLAKGAPLMPRPDAAGGAKQQISVPWYWRLAPGVGIGAGGYVLATSQDMKTLGLVAAGLAGAEGLKLAAGAGLRSGTYRNWLTQSRPPWTLGGALPNALTGAVNELNAQREDEPAE